MTIKEKIKKGENRTLEFKTDLPKGDQLSRTAVAFANGAGGEILIGVDDKGACFPAIYYFLDKSLL